MSVAPIGIAHVDPPDRCAVEWVGRGTFKVAHVTLRVGYRDTVDIPAALAAARKRGLLARNLDLEHASYYVSRMSITPTSAPGMSRWRKHCSSSWPAIRPVHSTSSGCRSSGP